MAEIIDAVSDVLGSHSNPLGDDGDVEDTNAVVCPDWFERARRVSVGGDGQPSRVVKLLPLASAVLMCGMMLAIV